MIKIAQIHQIVMEIVLKTNVWMVKHTMRKRDIAVLTMCVVTIMINQCLLAFDPDYGVHVDVPGCPKTVATLIVMIRVVPHGEWFMTMLLPNS